MSGPTASGACPALDQGYDLGRVDPLAVGPDMYGFEIFYRCADPRQLVLQNAAMFARAPAHLNIARVQRSGRVAEHVFTVGQQQWRLPDDGVPYAPGLAAYLSLGSEHILHSADRLLLILGLALLIQRRRDMGYIVLALALGYGLSLLTSQAGWVSPRVPLVEAFVGLLVALVGMAVILMRAQRRDVIIAGWSGWLLLAAIGTATMHSSAAALLLLGGAILSAGLLTISGRREGWRLVWPLLAALLGFVDGFLWSAVIEPAQLPRGTQTRMLIGVDLGAILIETAVAALLAGGVLLLRSRRLDRSRALVTELCAAGLAGCGTFWLASRLWV